MYHSFCVCYRYVGSSVCTNLFDAAQFKVGVLTLKFCFYFLCGILTDQYFSTKITIKQTPKLGKFEGVPESKHSD